MGNDFLRTYFQAYMEKLKRASSVEPKAMEVDFLLDCFGIRAKQEGIADLSQTAYSVINERTMEVLHVSDSFFYLTGYTPQQMKDEGTLFYVEKIHPDDLVKINRLFERLNYYQQTLAPEQLHRLMFTHNYRFKRADGRWLQLLQYDYCYLLEGSDQPDLHISVINDISFIKNDDSIKISFALYDALKDCYQPLHEEVLDSPSPFTEQEKRIIQLSSKGNANKQIADQMHISEQTVKNHKYCMFRKGRVQNMVELVTLSKENGWI